VNAAPIRKDGGHVLYWMIAARRRSYNFGLQRAAELARELGRPLVILEALRTGYRWASDRFHGFVLDGMAANERAFSDGRATYYAYVEPEEGAGSGLLAALAADAAVVVTDEFPCFFLPKMIEAAGKMLPVRLEAVDSNGLLPIASATTDFVTAYSFRRYLQKNLAPFLDAAEQPLADPLKQALPAPRGLHPEITTRWPAASPALLARDVRALAALPIDHSVGLTAIRGGAIAAGEVLDEFVDGALERYGVDRNHPDDGAASGLSPYLHFGHLSSHEIFARIVEREAWVPGKLSRLTSGKREGWWSMSAPAESFLDELITWRELGYNQSARNPQSYDRYDSLPSWARATLHKHAGDARAQTYTLDQLAGARTHDPVWNAAQTELVTEGRMHNYLRMLWGKKVLQWSRSPEQAALHLIELNNRYALDGRNPNSYSGIFWVMGRYDRPWAPERPIFGQIRYMSSENTVKKLHMKKYLARYARGITRELF